MGEIKQANFRIDQETADSFRKFCEENGMNQAQGFDHIMQIVELNKLKTLVPERLTEIEEFERLIKGIMSAYLNAVEICTNSEARAREQFSADIKRNDDIIRGLQEQVSALKQENESNMQAQKEAAELKEKAERERDLAQKKADEYKSQYESINYYYQLTLTEYQGAKPEFERIKKSEASLKAQIEELNQVISDNKKEAEYAIQAASANAKHELDIALLQAQAEKMSALSEKDKELQEKLRESDRIIAKLEAQVELLKGQ